MNIPLPDKLLQLFVTQSHRKNLLVDDYLEDLHRQLADKILMQDNFRVSFDDKLRVSEYVIEKLYKRNVLDSKIALAWTGGKDSTLLLWIVRRVLSSLSLPMPLIVLIDEGDMFEEVEDFCQTLADDWSFDYVVVRNDDVLSQVRKVGDVVDVDKLNSRNKAELSRLGFVSKQWNFEPESEVGNHLMKTVVQNVFLEQHAIDYLITGIRWDEQAARSNETYFSPRGDDKTPTHIRVHPILQFTEADVWDVIHEQNIPYVSLYEDGYRSLGAQSTTSKASDVPAWEQDLEKSTERAGRAQDKEQVMERLRKLGYM